MKLIRIDSTAETPMAAALMADSAVRPHRKPLFLPAGEWVCEIRPAVRIDRLGKAIAAKFASRYYNCVAAVNILRPAPGNDVASFEADMMDDAAVVGEWVTVDGFRTVFDIDRQYVDRVIEALSANTTLKNGDIIVLPQIIQSFAPAIDSHIKIDNLLDFNIK